MFGDGNRISDSPSLVLWLITNVFQTLRLTPLVDLEDISLVQTRMRFSISVFFERGDSADCNETDGCAV